MENSVMNQPAGTAREVADFDFLVTLVMAFLLGTGVTLLAFGVAYAQDLETLRTVPNAIWDSLCGRPLENGYTLPLIMAMGTLAVLVSAGLGGWQRVRRWQQHRVNR